jgi:D-cysteine desulfhydrase
MASDGEASSSPPLAIVRRFPALASLPRVVLGRFPSPVQDGRALAPGLWLKRDDLNAEPLGGNKVRALELLLARVRPGDRVVTVGATGSTHALATALHARRLGARASVYRWPQEMNEIARRVASRIEQVADDHPMSRSLPAAYARALLARLSGAQWVPAGGSSALGVIGHASAAIELAEQVARGELPEPRRIVAPLGSGGTIAGLLLGTAIAGLSAEIVGVRVVPRVVANRGRVVSLARAAARSISRLTREHLPEPDGARLRIVHGAYGGAYGRETTAGREAASRFDRWSDATIDATYGAKALSVALEEARTSALDQPTLFWVTFDGRWLRSAAELDAPSDG